jgi:DNA-binding IclR family transcriptional regulator
MQRAGRPIGVSDIARQTALSKAAVHHLLSTLESRAFVLQEPDSSLYRLSWALYELGATVVRGLDLSRAARPYLDRLAAQVNESVLLGILDEDSVLYIDGAEAPTGFRMAANPGRRGSLTATASGKVMLAHAPDERLLDRVLSVPLERFTSTTVTDRNTLARQLDDVRTKGYATCWEERELGLSSLAVPLRNYTRAVVGSLTIAGPSTRLNKSTMESHLAPLMRSARQIEIHLGGIRAEARSSAEL